MTVPNPGKCIGQCESVLRQGPGRGGRLCYADHITRIAEAAVDPGYVKVEEINLWNAEVCAANRLPLIKVPAREVSAQVIQHGAAQSAYPAHSGCIVVRQQRQIIDRPLSAIEVVKPDKERADKKLIIAMCVIHAPVVLISAAAVGHSKIEDAPVRGSVGAVSGPLSR